MAARRLLELWRGTVVSLRLFEVCGSCLVQVGPASGPAQLSMGQGAAKEVAELLDTPQRPGRADFGRLAGCSRACERVQQRCLLRRGRQVGLQVLVRSRSFIR